MADINKIEGQQWLQARCTWKKKKRKTFMLAAFRLSNYAPQSKIEWKFNSTGVINLVNQPLMLNWRNPRPFLSGPTARAPLFFFLLHNKYRNNYFSDTH
jgi:hypothetical protein